MRVIFCGTPEIAVPSLRSLAEIAEVVGVVCQPDRPAGRGMRLTPPPVKVEAIDQGFEVYQPLKVRDGTLAEWMRQRHADFALVIAYGRILTAEALNSTRLGCLNLHASILPEYRGAAPIQRVLMDGKSETGVCLMQMDEGMDTGPVLSERRLQIAPEDDAGSLAEKLGQLAATITKEDLPRFMNGELRAVAQDHARASYAPPLSKQDAVLDFHHPTSHLVAHVRGLSPRPGASCFLDETRTARFKLYKVRAFEAALTLPPGQVHEQDGQLVIGSADGALLVVEGQLEGKNKQSGADLLRGRVLRPGMRLTGAEAGAVD